MILFFKGVKVSPSVPEMLKVYDLAAKYNVPVNVHVDHQYSWELEKALEHNRKCIFIWAHSGYADPDLIKYMLDKHPNLYADISIIADRYKGHYRNITTSNGKLKQEWKDVFETYSDRLMFGSDMGMKKSRYKKTLKVTTHYRSLLGQLTNQAAENIAYKTAAMLFNISLEEFLLP